MSLPFGAEIEEGGVRFRLWAPAAKTVELCIEGGATLPMARAGGGWFELTTDDARAGTRYRYCIDGGLAVPDPASRFQPDDAHGPSEVVDPGAYAWRHAGWRGRPWHETVLYELHVGTFSPEGTFAGVGGRLDHLVALGVTAIELMPLADFPGGRNWGYDGVLPFAPDSAYGTPDDLKRLIDDAHGRGPRGLPRRRLQPFRAGRELPARLRAAVLHRAPSTRPGARQSTSPGARCATSSSPMRSTGWRSTASTGCASTRSTRSWTIRAPTYWRSWPTRCARASRAGTCTWCWRTTTTRRATSRAGRTDGCARYDAQWNDDIHHAMHVLATGERAGYYEDYAEDPAAHLARCLAEGFAYQGEPSPHRGGQARGEPSAHLPPAAFVNFLQNHDQVGNRAFGERIGALADPAAVAALAAIYLLAPSPPMIFMGEEWAAPEPFPFFCDFHDELADAVREGRRREFERFPAFRDPAARARIPDPNAETTFRSAVLDWAARNAAPHAQRLALYRDLLARRAAKIVPHLPALVPGAAQHERVGAAGIVVRWPLEDGGALVLCANPGAAPVAGFEPSGPGRTLYETPDAAAALGRGELPPWGVVWRLASA